MLSNNIELSTPQEWDLSDLYQSFTDPSFGQDLQSLQAAAAEFREKYRGKVSELSAQTLAGCLQQLEMLSEKSGYLYAFPSLMFAADTRNTEAKQYLDKVTEALTEVENKLLFFELELKQLSEEKLAALEESLELKNYVHYFQRMAEFRPYKLLEEVEQTRNQDNLTGRDAFIKLRTIHLGEQEYEPVTTADGNVIKEEAQLSALLFQGDAQVRYQAYQSVRNVIKEHNSLYAYILNIVAQDHRLENQMRGYGSTLEKQLLIDEVSEPVFRAIMEGTGSRYDLFQRYYQMKAKYLGEKIRICDIYAPWSREDEATLASINYRAGVETLLTALEQFDLNYARQAEEFFVNNWVDAKVRPGKRGGAFCSYTHGKHSYLLLSYTEDYSSLFTLAHEMGHGLHFNWIGENQSYFNSNPPLILAEVASIFNELLLLDYLLAQAKDDKNVRKNLLTRQLEDQFSLLFRQSTISRLELAIHQRAEQGSFDRHWINQTWMELYQNLCGDTVELLPEHQYDWARIGHIFFKPFYCYQYTASDIVSLACYQKYQELGKDFIPGYLQLLSAGGSLNQVEALRKYVGVDLEDSATIQGALSMIERLLDQLEASLF